MVKSIGKSDIFSFMTNSVEDSKQLPTLLEVVDCLKLINENLCDSRPFDPNFTLMSQIASCGWDKPYNEFINEADDKMFIVGRTQRKKNILKPNLRNCGMLFRGQRKKYPSIISSYTRDEYDKNGNHLELPQYHRFHLKSNLLAEDFIALLRTHPLFMLFERGIILPPEPRPVFIDMNYYGLAQHYNFNTGLVDFTTDIDVAAFFACTINKGNDVYEPVTDIVKDPTGVLYVHPIIPEETFKGKGFSTIGLQLYPRTGAQRGVFYNELNNFPPLNTLVKPILFRQDPNVSRIFYNKMDGGKKLFPKDTISDKAKEILTGNEVSGKTFAENLYTTQEDLEQNLHELSDIGMKVNWHKRRHFTPEMLHDVEIDLKNGLWEKFCDQICFVDEKKGEGMKESLLNLPKNPCYKMYFDMHEYNRLIDFDSLVSI